MKLVQYNMEKFFFGDFLSARGQSSQVCCSEDVTRVLREKTASAEFHLIAQSRCRPQPSSPFIIIITNTS